MRLSRLLFHYCVGRSLRFFVVPSCLVWCGMAQSAVLTVDPDAGLLSTGGGMQAGVLWRGVQISDGGIGSDGAREYLVHGDLIVDSGGLLPGTGSTRALVFD